MINWVPYASPRTIKNLEDCYFYHTIDVPGYGTMKGEWDLRSGVDDYLGRVDFKGKRVLELGTANGFLCFEMEKRGAAVVAVDLSENEAWDLVPYERIDLNHELSIRKAHIRKLNNAFWLGHRAFQSQARMVYTSVYELPETIGPVDISTFGSILLHLRDPFLALQKALRLTRETVIITDVLGKRDRFPYNFIGRLSRHAMRFRPRFEQGEPMDAWWILNPWLIKQFVGILGFEQTKVIYHSQFLHGRRIRLYTVVGQRTVSLKTE